MIKLGDDGTMDTVLVCDQCSEEMRYNYDASSYEDIEDDEEAYEAFIEWALEDAEGNHDCEDARQLRADYLNTTGEGQHRMDRE